MGIVEAIIRAAAFVDIGELAKAKDLGWWVVGVVILAKIGQKLLDWVLDVLGIGIKRGQSREDGLSTKVEDLDTRLGECESRLARLEQVYRVTHRTVHYAADGIEAECRKIPISRDHILFFVRQLRTIQTLEEVWSGAVAAPSVAVEEPARHRILAVDDVEGTALLVKATLEAVGHEVHTASSAQDALYQYGAARDLGQPFELLILDYQMPDEDGESLARAVRRQEAERGEGRVPIVFFTGHHDRPSEATLRELPAVRWTKPLAADVMQSRVRQVLAN